MVLKYGKSNPTESNLILRWEQERTSKKILRNRSGVHLSRVSLVYLPGFRGTWEKWEISFHARNRFRSRKIAGPKSFRVAENISGATVTSVIIELRCGERNARKGAEGMRIYSHPRGCFLREMRRVRESSYTTLR